MTLKLSFALISWCSLTEINGLTAVPRRLVGNTLVFLIHEEGSLTSQELQTRLPSKIMRPNRSQQHDVSTRSAAMMADVRTHSCRGN